MTNTHSLHRSLVRRSVALAAMSALVLAACGDDADSVPGDTVASGTQPVLAIDGATFLSDTVTGHTLVDGSRLRITFNGDQMGVQAGCNSMSGAYAIDDGTLTVDQMAMTEMACEEPLMAQDTWFADFLRTGPTITQDGDRLTLASGDTTIVFLDREVADPDRPLEGTAWTIDTVVTGDAVTNDAVTGSITFADGTAAVDTGCNTGSATYEVSADGTTITFGPLALTKMACMKDDATTMEKAFSAVLDGEVTVDIEAASITLMNGTDGLGGRAAE